MACTHKTNAIRGPMPKIHLKPCSAEFADDEEKNQETPCCNMPECDREATHKAPRDRSLGDYYWFCLEHVQEHNKAWNYFSGMSHIEVEDYIVRSSLWDRPTWRHDNFSGMEDHLHRKSSQTYHFMDKEPEQEQARRHPSIDRHSPEFEALVIMGLEPPLDLSLIKARYKKLVKKHHPDINGGSAESEELLKSINMAYTILKLAYAQFEKLPSQET